MEEADSALTLFAEKYREAEPIVGQTMRSWGRKYLELREFDGVHRSVQKDRYLWRRIDASPFADLPLVAVTSRDVRDWVATQLRTKTERTGKTPGRQTVVNALNLLRVSLEHACQSGVLEQNPANGVKVPRVARSKEAWTWLRTDEIAKLLGENVDLGPRCLFAFAIFTGLRAGEIFGLKWSDIDHTRGVASICRSWLGTPTKRGETREVHLFGSALEALKQQRARKLKGPWVFPNELGEPRTKNHKPDLDGWLVKANVKRHVRFHDLRHTCASHLVSGSWGRAWTLEEVAKHLGHSSSAVTRRYAHLCPEGLARAARETRPELQMRMLPQSSRTLTGPIPADMPENIAITPGFENRRGGNSTRGSNPFSSASFAELAPSSASSGAAAWGHVGPTAGPGDPAAVATRAVELLERMQRGACTTGDVAKLAADVLANPPPLIAAAQRFLREVGTDHEGAAAVAFLDVLATTSRSTEAAAVWERPGLR